MSRTYSVVDSKAILPTFWPLNYISVTNKIVNLVVSKSKILTFTVRKDSVNNDATNSCTISTVDYTLSQV